MNKHHQIKWPETLALLLFVLLINVAMPASAAKRFQERSLYINSAVPSETTFYKISFRYMNPDPVGSVEMLFCIDPIPYNPCNPPPGLDVSNAQLSDQTGEVDFSILSSTSNKIVLTRTPEAISSLVASSYILDNIVNPSTTNQAFAIRLKSFANTLGTGSQIDFGSIRGQVTESVYIETQVPPILIFCVAEQVVEDCSETNHNYYTDMGDLDPTQTLTAQSQMAVGTNASSGFVITANGGPPSAGINIINTLGTTAPSQRGSNQFGINLVANNSPLIGADPDGTWTNANPTSEYSTPNLYKFLSGEVVAQSPDVSLMRRFTVSYIINSREDIKPGVYTTTITYIASGRF